MLATIGIHVYEQPENLRASLEQLDRCTGKPYELILLADAPDDAALAALNQLADVPRLTLEAPSGGAAAFNLLCRHAKSDVAVLLESGCLVGPGWLDHLLSALRERDEIGLAGPSTNLCWNEQGVFRWAADGEARIAATAAEALRCFGAVRRTLEPLYSLADFCYAVKRKVWETIGPADEAYGTGPCWEMDYNVRAARAGFRGVWVQPAYVYRRPSPQRRQTQESLFFERNKRLYQSKFCARQIRERGAFFRDHCRGDACPNFAPYSGPAVHIGATRQVWPLVTCLMPTCDRRSFIADSIACFLAQDYPCRELLILDDGTDPVADLIPFDPRIRHERCTQKLSLGAKRNLGCQRAKGELIAHWDDDDWYPSWRLSRQVRALEQEGADVCGTSVLYYRDPINASAYRYEYAGGAAWVGGNTLLYRKDYWLRQPFDDINVGEDALFLWNSSSKKIADLKEPALCLGRIHSLNTSPKATETVCWQRVPMETVEAVLERDRKPLISCIMPTRGRRSFLPLAYELFRAQDYPRLELVIIDDGEQPADDIFAGDPRVRYVRLQSRHTIGEKRNIACRLAAGEIVVHWDDDDWYAPTRISHQVEPILRGEADLSGLENACTLDLQNGQCWTTTAELHRRMFVGDVHGGTLAFRRNILGGALAYPAADLAEDAALLDAAIKQGFRLARLPNPGLYVYIRHGRNAWEFTPGRFLDARGWTPIQPPALLPDSLIERYRAAARELAAS